jgi:AraC family transcriptional regulator
LSEPTRWLIAAYVDQALPSETSIDDLAILTGYSEAQFMRRFKATFHMPPHHYILERRVERAKGLICKTDLTLTTIAQQLGFASHAHFSTAFKRLTGRTPSDYRRSPPPSSVSQPN